MVLGLTDPAALAAAYEHLAARLGPDVLVCQTAPPGVELSLGLVRDPALGPLIVVGAGGVLVELLADRAVALPPVDQAGAHRLLGRLRAARLLAGVRGAPPGRPRRGRRPPSPACPPWLSNSATPSAPWTSTR